MNRLSKDQAVRSLVALSKNGSTTRTLNLHAVWTHSADIAGYSERRFFNNPTLNRSIIVKHRLRGSEGASFPDARATATKVIIPIDFTNLAAGARSFFVGQYNYETALQEVFKTHDAQSARDRELLSCLDGLPSFDPFLMRERLKKDGFEPDPCYYALTEADNARIFDAVRAELLPLVTMSFDGHDPRARSRADRLAEKILHNAGDSDLEPLRQGLGMTHADFAEGVFCWKGFIYYKWSLAQLTPVVRPIALEISQAAPRGVVTADDSVEIGRLRRQIARAIILSTEAVRSSIRVYEDAYSGLTRNDPTTFRDFLLRAPALFHELGERLGALGHIVSFWRFRFPPGQHVRIEAEELIELLSDFATSLNAENRQPV